MKSTQEKEESKLQDELNIRIFSIVQTASLGAFISGYTGSELTYQYQEIQEKIFQQPETSHSNLIKMGFNLVLIIGGIIGSQLFTQLQKRATKRTIMILADLLLITSVTFRLNSWQAFGLQRLLKGIANGLNICSIFVYVREISGEHKADKAIALVQINVNLGIVMATVLSLPLAGSDNNNHFWKFLLCFPALPAMLRILIMISIYDFDTPFSLIQRRKPKIAILLLHYLGILMPKDIISYKNLEQSTQNESLKESNIAQYSTVIKSASQAEIKKENNSENKLNKEVLQKKARRKTENLDFKNNQQLLKILNSSDLSYLTPLVQENKLPKIPKIAFTSSSQATNQQLIEQQNNIQSDKESIHKHITSSKDFKNDNNLNFNSNNNWKDDQQLNSEKNESQLQVYSNLNKYYLNPENSSGIQHANNKSTISYCLNKEYISAEGYNEFKSKSYKSRCIRAVVAGIIQQLCGINTIIARANLSVEVLNSATDNQQTQDILLLFLNLILLITAIVVYFNVTKLYSYKYTMPIGCILSGIFIIFYVFLNNTSQVQVIPLLTYYISFNSTLGPLTLIYVSYICKDVAIGNAVTSYYLAQILSSPIQEIDSEYIPLLFSGVCFFAAYFYYFYSKLAETSQRSFQYIDEVLFSVDKQ